MNKKKNTFTTVLTRRDANEESIWGGGLGFGKVGGEDVTSKINDFHHWKSQTMAGADCNWNETC